MKLLEALEKLNSEQIIKIGSNSGYFCVSKVGDLDLPSKGSTMDEEDKQLFLDAAAAIEELQAEVDALKFDIERAVARNTELLNAEPKRGEWIDSRERMRPDMCSVCGCIYEADRCMDKIAWNYCPKCGAKMGGKDEIHSYI